MAAFGASSTVDHLSSIKKILDELKRIIIGITAVRHSEGVGMATLELQI